MRQRLAGRIGRNRAVRPSAITVVNGDGDGDEELSYAEFGKALDSAVATLRAAGVSAGDVAVVQARRVVGLPLALLSLWELNATAAIVDAGLPATRMRECEEVVRPDWLLTIEGRSSVSPAKAARTDPARPRGGSTNGGHILFTSGTTGRPAAVEVGPGALRRTLEWYLRTFRPGPADRVAMLAGLGHDPVLRDMLVPLLAGGTLVLPPGDVFAAPDRLLSFIRAARITILHCTPALLELILAAQEGENGRRLNDLRLVVSAGAPLRWGIVRRLLRASDAVVVNAYGSTETPQIASCRIITPTLAARYADLPDEAGVPVGVGVGGAELLLAGAGGRWDRWPARGEVIVRSRDLARGYLGGTGADGRFLPDPRGIPGYRAYRTGDLGEREPDGGIRIVGRLDRQMSINGHRIAPEEIERAVLRHPGVRQAVAEPISVPAGNLIGLRVVLAATEPTESTDARSLRAFLRSVLPGFAVPAQVRIVPELPLDANHKPARLAGAAPAPKPVLEKGTTRGPAGER